MFDFYSLRKARIAAEGRARTIPVECGRSVLCFKGIARIQSAVLQEKEGIAVDLVRAYTRDDIDGALDDKLSLQ